MSKAETHVAITGFAGTGNPEPGGAVARALRAGWGAPLVIDALGYDAWMTAAWPAGLVDRLHIMPNLTEPDDAVLRRILEIHRQRPLDALIPTLDLEVQVFARLADDLNRAGIATLLPSPEAVLAVTKTILPLTAHRKEILTPRTIHVLDLEHVPFYADQLGYPLLVKGSVADAKRAENVDEAKFQAHKLARKWGGGILLQELIAGEEYCVAMVAGRDGALLGQVAMRKLATTGKGKGAVGAVVRDPTLENEAKRILAKLNWVGPLELEFIRVPATGQLYLIEINCRFPSWIMLSEWAGQNLPVLALRTLLQMRSNGNGRARPGTAFVRDIAEVSVPGKVVDHLRRFGDAPAIPKNGHDIARGKDGIAVAVTGISARDAVMAGLGVARALRRSAEIGPIYGLGYGPYDSGVYRNETFDAVFRIPDSEDPEDLLRRLKVIRNTVDIDVIVPCLDVEMPRFIAIQSELEAMGIRMLLPPADAVSRTTKLRLFLDHNRFDWGAFRIPETYKIWTLRGIGQAAKTLGFPMVIKGKLSGAKVVRNLDEARVVWASLRSQGHEEALAQRYFSGDEFALAAVCDSNHDIIGDITIKKQLTDGGGSTWSARRVDQPALLESFAAFLRDLEWCGPVEGEFIRDDMEECFYLFEVNPRPTAWIDYAAHCGANLPLETVLAAAGRPKIGSRANGDLVFMRSAEDIQVKPVDLATFSAKGYLSHD